MRSYKGVRASAVGVLLAALLLAPWTAQAQPPTTGGPWFRPNCTTLTNPTAANLAACWDTTRGYLTGWDGTGWQSDVALATKMVNVMDPRFGAKFDGLAATDDGPAVQAAINAVSANGGTVYLPCGITNWNTGVTISTEHVRLVGCGMKMEDNASPTGGTEIVYRGTTQAILFGITAAQSYGNFQGGIELKDFAIVGTSAGLNGIKLQSNGATNYAHRFLIENVYIGEFTGVNADGLLINYGLSGTVRRTYTRNIGACGIKIGGGTTLAFRGVISRLNKTGICLVAATGLGTSGVMISDQSVLESNTGEGLVVDSTLASQAALSIYDTRFENNNTSSGTYQMLITGAAGKITNTLRAQNLLFSTSNGAGGDISLDFVTGATLEDIYSGTAAGKNLVKLNSTNAIGVALSNIVGAGGAVDPDNRAAYVRTTTDITQAVWKGTAVAGLYGGTGLATAAVGDLIYASATTPTWSRLADVAAGSHLRAGGVNTAPLWSTPTWPNAATTTGAYLRADGTNWIMSTLILPNAITANQVVYGSAPNTYGASTALIFDGSVLGITTTTDVSGLTVTGSGTAKRPFLILQRSDSTTSAILGGVQFNNSAGAGLAQITAVADGASDSAMIEFVTQPTGGSAVARWRIDSTGNLRHAGVLFANLGTPTNGSLVFCTDCDPPTLVDSTCTSAGTKTGSLAFRVNAAWKCIS